jgi:DNA-binding FadR family transcriptional regulator
MNADVTAAHIARSLATDVHEGRLQAGEMFPSERDLCARFGVGRTLVRHSMTILQGMRLADQSKGKRPRVVEPTLGQLMAGMGDAAKFFFMGSEGRAHLEQARLFLETSLLRYAVIHITNAQMARLVATVEACDASIDDHAAFRSADVGFHRVLAEVPGNPIFVALHEAFVERMMKSRPALDDFVDRNLASNDEHKSIVQAMLDKDTDKAIDILTRHLTRNYGSDLRQKLDRQVSEPSQ